jgi:hypothetical protein
MDAYDMKILVSKYQSIDMHCMVVPVKFDDGLSITFLRKKPLSTKKRGSKVYIFKKVPIFKNISSPAIWTDIPLERVPLFLDLHFLVNGIDNSPSNLT